MNLIVSVPALRESAAPHYEAWERVISEFVADRIGQPVDSLFPLAIGRTVLAASRAANIVWVARADTALAAGFAPVTIAPPASSGSRCSPLSM
jgi:hypothetical protein